MSNDSIILAETLKAKGYISPNRNLLTHPSNTVNFNKPQWPNAYGIFENLYDTKGAKLIRALEIASMVPPAEANGPVLDYGCGEGYTVRALNLIGRSCTGYDKVRFDEWQKLKVRAFNNMDDIVSHSPYAMVLLYDVLDHMSVIDMIKSLSDIKKVLADKSQVFLRVHPFTSRNGSHFSIDRAFLHLMLTTDEMNRLRIERQNVEMIINPMHFYDDLFGLLGFTVVRKIVHQTSVEEFISRTYLGRIRDIHFNISDGDDHIKEVLSVDFIDYWLNPN